MDDEELRLAYEEAQLLAQYDNDDRALLSGKMESGKTYSRYIVETLQARYQAQKEGQARLLGVRPAARSRAHREDPIQGSRRLRCVLMPLIISKEVREKFAKSMQKSIDETLAKSLWGSATPFHSGGFATGAPGIFGEGATASTVHSGEGVLTLGMFKKSIADLEQALPRRAPRAAQMSPPATDLTLYEGKKGFGDF